MAAGVAFAFAVAFAVADDDAVTVVVAVVDDDNNDGDDNAKGGVTSSGMKTTYKNYLCVRNKH